MSGLRRLLIGGFLLVFSVGAVTGAVLEEEEARRMTLKAAEFIEKNGIEAARERFHEEGEFKFGEIYVNVIDMEGVWVVFPPKPTAEGRNVSELRDVDNNPLVKNILDVARSAGEGWVRYRWHNPATRQIQLKITYVKTIPSLGLVAYVGVYQ